MSVLSNSTFADKPSVHEALLLVDNNILKLDTVNQHFIEMIDRPLSKSYDVRKVIETMKSFDGHVIIQTMFLRGNLNGIDIDNTGDNYVGEWLEAIKYINPQQVMIYTIDRETPNHNLLKALPEQLDVIRDKVIALGIPCTASY